MTWHITLKFVVVFNNVYTYLCDYIKYRMIEPKLFAEILGLIICLFFCVLGPPQTRVKKQETRNKKQNGLAHSRFIVCVTPKQKKTLLDSRIKF